MKNVMDAPSDAGRSGWVAVILAIMLVMLAVALSNLSIANAADKGGPPALDRASAEELWGDFAGLKPSCYVELLGSRQIGTAKASDDFGELSISASKLGLSAGVGCDVRTGRIVTGVFARLDAPDAKAVMNHGDWHIDSSWTAAGRVGYLINPGTLVYGVLGAQGARIDFGMGLDSLEKTGVVYGPGLQIAIAPQLSLKAEWLRTELGTFREFAQGLTVKPTTDTVRVGVTWTFSGFLLSSAAAY